MSAIFFAKSGHMASVPRQERKIVNVEWHVNICWPKVFEGGDLVQTTGPAALLPHHDNANAHTAAATLDYLEANRVQLVTQTPYSPGIAPCDFFSSFFFFCSVM